MTAYRIGYAWLRRWGFGPIVAAVWPVVIVLVVRDVVRGRR